MNAKEFIKQYGWEMSKAFLNNWSSLSEDYGFKVDDLKQLVDAWELVQVHGLSKSKDIVDDAPSDDLYYSWLLGESGIKEKTVHIGTLKQAIELVESVK